MVGEATAAHPDKPVEVWATDLPSRSPLRRAEEGEHRLGLKPVRRRVLAPIGQRPIALGHHRYEWLHVTAFVEPATGQVVWYLANRLSKAFFEALLAAFAAEIGAGLTRIVVLVLDNAGWHTPEGLAVPDGIRLVFLPPYSPELQPAECLWPLLDEPIVNRHFATIEDLDTVIAERCNRLDPAAVAPHTAFNWWPTKIRPN